MTTKTDICNLAIGYASITTDIDDVDEDQSAEAIQCRRVYQTYLDSMLQDFPWSFARATRRLTKMDEESEFYEYVYALPSDCLAPIAVVDKDSKGHAGYIHNHFGDYGLSERHLIKFEKSLNKDGDQKTIITDLDEAYLHYTVKQEDPSVYPENFIDALAMRIGSFLALTIVKSKSEADNLMSMYREAGANASLRDAQGQNSISPQITQSARARRS